MIIGKIIERYKQYNLYYDVVNQVLISKKPMLVSDFVNIRNIIKENNLRIKEIRIIGR